MNGLERSRTWRSPANAGKAPKAMMKSRRVMPSILAANDANDANDFAFIRAIGGYLR